MMFTLGGALVGAILFPILRKALLKRKLRRAEKQLVDILRGYKPNQPYWWLSEESLGESDSVVTVRRCPVTEKS